MKTTHMTLHISPLHLRMELLLIENRQMLRVALEAEQMYGLMTKLVLSIDRDSAFCAAEDAIPCVMHGGNRINEKNFMMVLIEAWESCESA
jgi:hypothetical protein